MNEVVILDNFKELSQEKQIEFFKYVKTLKQEFKVIREENTILKEGLNAIRSVE